MNKCKIGYLCGAYGNGGYSTCNLAVLKDGACSHSLHDGDVVFCDNASAQRNIMVAQNTSTNKPNTPFYKTVPSCSCGHKGYVNVCSKCG